VAGRHAVPAISTAHLTRDDEARIAEAFRHEPHAAFYAVVGTLVRVAV